MPNIVVLPGDGIGPEIVAEAVKVLKAADEKFGLNLSYENDLLGGQAIDVHGVPLADSTLEKCRKADAILMGSVGGPKWDAIEAAKRPEKGLLKFCFQQLLD